MDTHSKLKSTCANTRQEAMIELFKLHDFDKPIAEAIYWGGHMQIVPRQEICWVCPHVTQVKQFRYGKYVLEYVDRKVIFLKGKALARPVRIYLYEISEISTNEDNYYDKLKGQKQGINLTKAKRIAIGYLTEMVSLIRKDFKNRGLI